jgi:hypothetical protein
MLAYLPIQSMQVKIIKEASLQFLQAAGNAAGTGHRTTERQKKALILWANTTIIRYSIE